ncbi:MAG: L-aspartate oxidase [Phycisphaerales bacterium]|nr:L-aspartate oxidase [Phycisphaerales bacterium]
MHALFDERRYLIPFRASLLPQIFCDTLVIGSGVAGLRAAIAAAEHGEVILLAKGDIRKSSTAWAQGGIAAVLGASEQAVRMHVEDTIDTGGGLCDPAIVESTIAGARPRIEELRRWGMRFDVNEEGEISLGREGGHRESRILHSDGDATGRELVRCLGQHVQHTAPIRVFENCFALDLLTVSDGDSSPVVGAITHHPKYGLQMIWAWATIIATGGAGGVYRETTNPAGTTGDGIAMAYRAGAAAADMAFIQFHPTTLYVAGAERSLITEAVRGEGAHLVDRRGERFMLGAHPMAELAPRDVVSRAIIDQLADTGDSHVFLDARHFKPGFFAERFPGIAAQLARFDIDPEHDLIPVQPSAHYTIGGIHVDAEGRTNRPGLYACGEAACSRLHGANRLASNSLLEGLVRGEITGRTCVEQREPGNGPRAPKRIISDIALSEHGGLDLTDVRSSLRSVVWRHLGITRSGQTMSDVRDMIDFWGRYTLDKIFDDPMGWETQNMLLVAALICKSALWRQESRGVHNRRDFPESRDAFRCHDVWRKGQSEPATIDVPPLATGATT